MTDLKIDIKARRRELDEAKAGGRGEEALRLELVLALEQQLVGEREQYSSCAPPAFFVRAYALGADGEFDWCEPFYTPDVCSPDNARRMGKVTVPPGRLDEAATEPCPHCGAPAHVVGEYYHDIQPLSLTSFTVRLFLYCRHCPRVTDLVEFERQTFDLARRLRGCKR